MDDFVLFALLVKAIDRELHRRVNEAMLPLGVTGPQADALLVIGQAGRLSLKQLGELLIAEGGHPSRLVDRLVDAGYVERRPVEGDRRRVELSLTADGRRVLRKIIARREALIEVGRELVPPREMDAVMKALLRLLEHTPHVELVRARRELDREAARSDRKR